MVDKIGSTMQIPIPFTLFARVHDINRNGSKDTQSVQVLPETTRKETKKR